MTRFLGLDRQSRAWIASIVLLLIVAAGLSAGAATIEDLYSVRIDTSVELAAGQIPRTREEQLRFAMQQLLTRVTGRLDAAFEPVLGDMLANAERYLVQMGTIDRETLLVTFDARAIESALVAREQPIWGLERPLTLLWLAIDAQGERDILSAGEASGDLSLELQELEARYREEIANLAEERGLLFELPLMDLEDMGALSFVDIWAGFGARVDAASQRYGADAVVMGRARTTSFGTEVDWTLIRDRQNIALGSGSLRDGLDRLADFYAAEFSTFGEANSVLITVLGIETLEDYGRVMRYLESVSVLGSIGTEIDFDGNALSVRVEARGGTTVLSRVLGLSTMLVPNLEFATVPGESRAVFDFVR